MHILITGGFGFLGGRLGKFLQEEGNSITLGSRAVSEPPKWLPQARVLEMNWLNQEALRNSCVDVDVVIHAAGMNARECEEDPAGALSFNGGATARLVAAASEARVKKLIYLSTAHVYSSPLEGVIIETTEVKNLHPYATSHLAGESAVLTTKWSGGRVIRLSNAFGAPTHRNVNCWMLLVNELCRQVIERRKITLRTNGMQYRDFVDMNRVCGAISIIIRSDFDSNKKIFNLGFGISKSVLEMAKLIQSRCEVLLGFKPDLEITESSQNEKYYPLIYRSENLISSAVLGNQESFISEIDNLIFFCKENFKYKKVG
jgi:UDP-glucose 4-epimerase